MRIARFYALCAVLITPLPATAQSSDLGRSLSQLVDTVVTTNKQRKILLELSSPLAYAPAAGPIDPANRNDPRNMDIAGIRLGMTVKEAQMALRTAGYIDAGPRDTQQSYADRVVYTWHTKYGYQGQFNQNVEKELLWNKGEEQISVKLLALPEGTRVSAIEYRAGETAPISSQEFTRRVLAKYGEPVNDDASRLRWCTVKAPDCETGYDATYPLLEAYPHLRHLVLTGNDPAQKAAFESRFEADVERRKPADQAPSF